ncbi:MAG TPA: hypothetical protein VGG94_05230 [Chthoniobacterales bacterium]
MKKIILSLLTATAALTLSTAGAFAGEEALPTGQKLDAQLLLALKQSRGQPPFDKPTSLQPDIPVKDGASVLVDIDATVSADLVTHIPFIGGTVAPSPDTSHIIRAMIPLSQLEALAGRGDVRFISTARPTVTARIGP